MFECVEGRARQSSDEETEQDAFPPRFSFEEVPQVRAQDEIKHARGQDWVPFRIVAFDRGERMRQVLSEQPGRCKQLD